MEGCLLAIYGSVNWDMGKQKINVAWDQPKAEMRSQIGIIHGFLTLDYTCKIKDFWTDFTWSLVDAVPLASLYSPP